jgi:GT2 family glycosyltransferase
MILVITVNYNNSNLTNEMIETINTSFTNQIDIIVVDNNSKDKYLLNKYSNSKFILLDKNIGYFPAINKGLEGINIADYEYVIICNNDLKFDFCFFDLLMHNKYDDNIYAICPKIIDLDGINQNPMLDKRISKFKIFFYDLYYKNYYFGQILYKIWQIIKSKKSKKSTDESRHIFMGYGAIYVLCKNFFSHNLKLDSPPFLMGEESFLAYQIYNTGGIEYYDHTLKVIHKDHSTCSKLNKRKMYNITKESYKEYRGKLLLLPKVK